MERQISAGNYSRIEIRDTFLFCPSNDDLVNPSNEQIFNLIFTSFKFEQKEGGGHSPAPTEADTPQIEPRIPTTLERRSLVAAMRRTLVSSSRSGSSGVE